MNRRHFIRNLLGGAAAVLARAYTPWALRKDDDGWTRIGFRHTGAWTYWCSNETMYAIAPDGSITAVSRADAPFSVLPDYGTETLMDRMRVAMGNLEFRHPLNQIKDIDKCFVGFVQSE